MLRAIVFSALAVTALVCTQGSNYMFAHEYNKEHPDAGLTDWMGPFLSSLTAYPGMSLWIWFMAGTLFPCCVAFKVEAIRHGISWGWLYATNNHVLASSITWPAFLARLYWGARDATADTECPNIKNLQPAAPEGNFGRWFSIWLYTSTVLITYTYGTTMAQMSESYTMAVHWILLTLAFLIVPVGNNSRRLSLTDHVELIALYSFMFGANLVFGTHVFSKALVLMPEGSNVFVYLFEQLSVISVSWPNMSIGLDGVLMNVISTAFIFFDNPRLNSGTPWNLAGRPFWVLITAVLAPLTFPLYMAQREAFFLIGNKKVEDKASGKSS